MCSLSPHLQHRAGRHLPVLHSGTSLKQWLQKQSSDTGTISLGFLHKRDISSWEVTICPTPVPQNASFTQMHNMLSSQWTRRQEAQCKTAPVQISAWTTQQKLGSYNSRQVKSTIRLTVWDSPKITKKFKPAYFDNTEPSPTRSFE